MPYTDICRLLVCDVLPLPPPPWFIFVRPHLCTSAPDNQKSGGMQRGQKTAGASQLRRENVKKECAYK